MSYELRVRSSELKEIDLKEIEEKYYHILKDITGEGVQDIKLTMLKGDASDRRYYRIEYNSKLRTPNSIIMMVLAEPYPPSSPPLKGGAGGGGELPFINVQQHLKKCAVAVPEIYHYDKEKGILFLEDCGDITLEEWMKERDADTISKYYKRIIDSLLNIQIKGSDSSKGDCVAFSLKFNVEKLMWELNFMIEHMIFGLRGLKINDNDLEEMRGYLSDLCIILSDQKQYLNHRDYHSRNIMIKNGELRFLDFQDARMGPCQYDLASLLRDSYTVLDDKLVDALVEYYISNKERIEGEDIDRTEFRKVFDYMSIQRNLKAIGTFAYQKMSKGNYRYLENIPPTLEYIRRNLEKYQALSGLKKLLYKYLF